MNTPVISIVLDSSILVRDYYLNKSDESTWLNKLSRKGLVKILIPYFVKEEVISRYKGDLEKNILKPHENLKEYTIKQYSLFGVIPDIMSMETTLHLRCLESVSHLRSFYESTQFQNIPFDPRDSKKVFEKYFSGDSGVFYKNKKNRNDIPDAFIYESIVTASREYKGLIALVKDQNLKRSIEKNNIQVYSSITELFTENHIVKNLKLKEEQKSAFTKEREFLLKKVTEEYLDRLNQYDIDFDEYFINDFIKAKHGQDSISSLYKIPLEYDESCYPQLIDPFIRSIDFISHDPKDDDIKYSGEGEGFIKFKLCFPAIIEFIKPKPNSLSVIPPSHTTIKKEDTYYWTLLQSAIVETTCQVKFKMDYELLKKQVNQTCDTSEDNIKYDISFTSAKLLYFSNDHLKAPYYNDEGYEICSSCNRSIGECIC